MKLLVAFLITGIVLCAAPILTITGSNPDGSYVGNLDGGKSMNLWCIDFFRPIADDPWPVQITHYDSKSAPLNIKMYDWLVDNRLDLPNGPIEATYAVWLIGSGGQSPHEYGAWPLVIGMTFMPGWGNYKPDLWLFDGGCFTQRYITTEYDGGNVPEPGSMALIGGGMVALVWIRKRR